MVAENDQALVSADQLIFGDTIQLGNVYDNDSDPEDDQFAVSSVSGGGVTDTTTDADGWFNWIDADQGGETRINTDGRFEFRDSDGDFFDVLISVQTSVQYEVLDERGAADTALVTVEVLPGEGGSGDDIFD